MSKKKPEPQTVVTSDSPSPLGFLGSTASGSPIAVESRIDHAPLQDGHPIFSLVGQAASEFARLEHILDETIWMLAGLEAHRGASITSQVMGVGPRCLTIIALHANRALPEETRKKTIANFMNTANELSSERNRLIHDPWYLNTYTGSASQLRSMPKKELIYDYKPVSEEYVKGLITKIRGFIEKAVSIRDQIISELCTSP